MDNGLYFIQLIHPRKEPSKKLGEEWSFNTGHHRKFLVSPGEYVDGKRVKKSTLEFWGEWEAQSKLLKEIQTPEKNHPHFFFEPCYKVIHKNILQKEQKNLQNTDPFVFGGQFLYGICMQFYQRRIDTSKDWTSDNLKIVYSRMRQLDKGSVILFGSWKDGQFVLDTVFVVRDWVDYTEKNYKSCSNVENFKAYKEISLDQFFSEDFQGKTSVCGCLPCIPKNTNDCSVTDGSDELSLRLYYGATYSAHVEGMYSYAPCHPFEDSSTGFASPVISIPDCITGNLKQGRRQTAVSSLDEMKSLWDKVKKQVEEAGLFCGVYFDLPDKHA